MQFALLVIFALLAAAVGCRAADPSTQPAAMQASLAVAPAGNVWTATITWTNPTDHGLSLGRYTSYSLIRTDVNPPATIASSPTGTLAPHFRILLPAHSSKTSTLTFYDKNEPLSPGKYHLAISFPHDILPAPLHMDFTVPPPATTAPASR
jgi:hypothetical protein